MTRTWSLRLIAAGGLALALGCRSHPAVPVCTTPLFPEDVVRLHTTEKPALTAASPPGVSPPAQAAKLPESAPAPSGEVPSLSPPKELTGSATTDPAPVTEPPVVDAPRPAPAEDGFVPARRVPAASPEAELRLPDAKPAEAPALPLKPGEKLGHAPDYHWVAGTLDRHLKAGYWTLRYADFGEDDPWGGKVRLLDSDRLKALRDGDVVYVEGVLLAPASAAGTAAYPPFRVTSLTVIEKAP